MDDGTQELGSSQSSYSLKDQDKLNPAFNDENRTHSMADLRDFTEKLASEWKVEELFRGQRVDLLVNGFGM